MRKMSSTHSLLHRVSSMLLFTLLLIIGRACASSLSIDSYSGSGSLAQEECSTENCRLPVERRLTSLSALGISSDVSWKQKYFVEALHGYRVRISYSECQMLASVCFCFVIESINESLLQPLQCLLKTNMVGQCFLCCMLTKDSVCHYHCMVTLLPFLFLF